MKWNLCNLKISLVIIIIFVYGCGNWCTTTRLVSPYISVYESPIVINSVPLKVGVNLFSIENDNFVYSVTRGNKAKCRIINKPKGYRTWSEALTFQFVEYLKNTNIFSSVNCPASPDTDIIIEGKLITGWQHKFFGWWRRVTRLEIILKSNKFLKHYQADDSTNWDWAKSIDPDEDEKLSIGKCFGIILKKIVNDYPIFAQLAKKKAIAAVPHHMAKADVDVVLNEGKIDRKDGICVIIGNKDYEHKDVPSVDFAIHDATIMKEYAIKVLGFREGNIVFEPNATKAKFEAIFGTKDNYKGKLWRWIKPDKSDVFIYYSGHGAPDIDTKKAYLLPIDCDPSDIALTGYSLNVFYNNLSKLPAKSITVVIDACFSGGSARGMLIKGASPIYIEVKNPIQTMKNAVILSSTARGQISSWYEEKKHSLFTYFFLKGLKGEADKDKNGNITIGEIKEYLTKNVPYMARRLHGREQTPIIIGNLDMILVKYK